MKVIIHRNGKDRSLSLPNFIVFSRLSASIFQKDMEKDVRKQVSAQMRRFAREHPGFVLVEAELSGEIEVKVTL